jgi:hypothetical protein
MIIVLIAVVGVLLITTRCLYRNDDAATKIETASNAAADGKKQPGEYSLSAEADEGVDLPEREEIRQMHKLTPGTKVFVIGLNDARVDTADKQAFVMGINGGVKVETADTDTAEVLIVRSARKREELQHRQVKITKDENLFIRIEDDRSLGPVPEIRERVIMRLPRKVGLEIHVVYGNVTVGESEGRLEVRNVDGSIRVARAAGPMEISNVNGGIDITLAPLTGNSISICGSVNGDVALRFDGEVNADLRIWSVNGEIKPDFQGLDVPNSEPERGRFKARIGTGGSVIEVCGINGNVALARAGRADTSASKVATK